MAPAKFEYPQAEEIHDRAKDRESLPRLIAFRDYRKTRR